MAATFTAQVEAWVKKTKQRMLLVKQESAQRVVDEILRPRAKGGNLRVDTGFMRSSFRMSLNAPTLGTKPNPGTGTFASPDGAISMVIANCGIDDDLYGTFGANYAIYREYGSRGQPGDGMVRLAAQKWPEIVNQVVIDAKSRAGS